MAFDNILVVCVGNICRSPIAEALLSEQYPQKNIDSAGVSALVGHSADSKAIEAMKNDGIDISNHIAKQIDESLVVKSDLILTMSDHQTKWIESQWPHSRGKTFKIGHWIDKDIADPYKLDKQAFETAKQDIIDSLDQWTDKIS
ncbi:low molecular weight protein-tyrosine-phosphatase [Psychrobacter jeotgali]|uniref:low molecular weight protein-tyrosine-phosphatase n=1 Tax=Psychrobacter jeotgali TaxID=179010 RepID=UPI001919A8E9|nr:low molecular weight protein-tyrosine-phosphatase [Psychrobacter jeotgali]